MNSPFDPPSDVVEMEQARASMFRTALVMGTWALCCAAVGTAAGVTRLSMGLAASATLLGAAGLVLGALVGAVVYVLERRAATGRPEVIGANGVAERPLHGAALVVPLLGAGAPGLLWLAGLSSTVLDRPEAAVLFVVGGVCAAWVAHRVWAQHMLARGLEAYQTGDGIRALAAVADARWSPPSIRNGARVNLAMVALQDGRGEDALRWLDGTGRGPAAAWSAVGRALAWLLVAGHTEEADAALREALRLPGRPAVEAEVDAVRVLLVWRQEGAAVARELAQQLDGPGASALHRALLAASLHVTGDSSGAERASRHPAVQSLLASGLGRSIGELDPLRAR